MADDFVIARNPEEGTSLPYLIRIPLGPHGIVLKVREMWPRTSKVYCHRAEWSDDPEILEQVPTGTCTRGGAAIDLVLDRGRENRSQFVMTIWLHTYNHHRGHTALGGQSPADLVPNLSGLNT